MDSARPAMPRDVWALGLVSLFMDIASEMIHSVLPVFLVTVLAASMTTVGLIEGSGEATASIVKLFSGWMSDRTGKRKGLTLLGYGLGAASKPLFALAPSTGWILAARISDRVGKGVRGAPRDALLTELAPAALRGAAFGLRQSLDTVGAFAGPLLALGLMTISHDRFRLVFSVAIVPGLLSVLILLLAVREPQRAYSSATRARPSLRWRELTTLPRFFWTVTACAVVLTFARFSEAFLLLRARDFGMPTRLIPLVLVVMNIVYAASAYPMGVWSDRIERRLILLAGFVVLILADLTLAYGNGLGIVLAGVALWGLHMGMTQGLLSAWVADSAPAQLRATAFGLFNFCSGIALLAASYVAGALWQWAGPKATFMAGAIFTAIGLLGAFAAVQRRPQSS